MILMFCKCQCQDGGRVRKPKHTKEHIKKDSIRYLIKKF